MTGPTGATIYEQSYYGEPLVQSVQQQPLRMHRGWLIVGEWPIELPAVDVRPAPDIVRMAAQIREWTGWSSRRLAGILGTSHTTVRGIESGRSLVPGHSGDLRRRLGQLHDVVARVFLLAGRDAARTAWTLEAAPPNGVPAIEWLREGQSAKAYLSAIDVLRPRSDGLIVGRRPRRDGATAPLHE